MQAAQILAAPPKDTQSTAGARSARLVLLIVFGLSTVLGVLAFWRYQQSERFIRSSLGAFHEQGAALSVERCVDDVVVWTENCSAIIGLCDASVSRMMNACLGARDRSAYCASIPEGATADTRFGHEACQRRGVKRRTKKACAAAYRMLAAHCELKRQQQN